MWPTWFIPGGPKETVYYLTSRPYPYYYVESIKTSGAYYKGVISPPYTEFMTTLPAFDSGELRTVRKSYSMSPESITASGTFDSGDLRTVRKSYTMAPESITSSPAFDSGLLKTARITYSNYQPESITCTPAFVSGSLT